MCMNESNYSRIYCNSLKDCIKPFVFYPFVLAVPLEDPNGSYSKAVSAEATSTITR